MIVIMNKIDYIHEMERDLNSNKFYFKLDNNPSQEIKLNIQNCINKISEINSNITSKFDIFPDNIRTSQFYILP
jgi:translation initiation factor IF-2